MRKFSNIAIFFGLVILIVGPVLYYKNDSKFQTSVYRFVYPSACDSPVAYKISRVDKEFNLDSSKFAKFVSEGANIWNTAYGERLFVYDSKADLNVNLIFDERQRLTNQINQMSGKITSSESALKPEIAKHQQDVSAFQKRVDDFNSQVKYWNDRGGAPEGEYQKLTQEQSELQKQAETLNARAQELNQSAVQFNSVISNYNTTVSAFNSTLKERPEEGLFNGKDNTISIYFYVNDPELVHTLAHEFGHALGVGHVQNPEALMFSKTNQNTTLTKEDADQLSKVCLRMPIWEKLRGLYL